MRKPEYTRALTDDTTLSVLQGDEQTPYPIKFSKIKSGVLGGFTQGSVLFAGTSGEISQDNTNLFWDNANKKLGINKNNPTHSVDLVGGIGSDYVQLDTTATPTPSKGMIFWDIDEETAAVRVNGIDYELGQGLFWVVKNQTGSQINKGTAVYAAGTLGASSRILAAPMIADGSIEAKYFLGIAAEDIANGDDGKVITQGKVRQINTTAYNDGDVLWVSPTTAGDLTNVEPTGNNLALAVAFVVHAAGNGVIAVRVSNLNENDLLAIKSLNGLTDATQLFAVGSSGTTPNISSSGDTHTFNFPLAGSGVTSGTISDGAQTIDGAKTLSSALTLQSDLVFPSVINVTLAGQKFIHTSGGGGGGGLYENLFIGYGAGAIFTGTGYANTVIGRNAAPLFNGTSALASSNVLIGYNVASALTNGSFNTVLGTAAAQAITTQTRNTFLGYHSGRLATSSDACGVGAFALENSTSNNGNTAVGTRALQLVTSGGFNTAVGWQAGNANTGEQNTFIGYNAGGNGAATGGFNTVIGSEAGRGITSGTTNVIIGRRSGFLVTTGANNVYIGSNNNLTNSTGSSNILIGVSLNTTTTTSNSQLNIGNVLFGTSMYSVGSGRIGVNTNSPVGALDVRGSGTTSSTYTAQFHNSTGTSNSLVVRDDGKVGIGTSAPASRLEINIPLAGSDGITINTNDEVYSLWGNSNLSGLFLANGSVGTQSGIFLQHSTGNVGIGLPAAIARLQVRGSGTTSATTALLVQNSATTNLYQSQDDGRHLFNAFLSGETSSDFVFRRKTGSSGNVAEFISSNDNNIRISTTSSGANAIHIFKNIGDAANTWLTGRFNNGAYRIVQYTGADLGLGSVINAAYFDTSGAVVFNAASVNASAQVQIDSTTKGFLPPRMTTAQKNAIASPAAGLVVYDTTLNKLCVYTTAWETITSV